MTQAAKHIFETAKAPTATHTPDWKVLPYYGSAGEIFMGFDIVEVGPRETSDRIAIVKLTDVYHGNKDICKQRADLIAAAPKLLEALKGMLSLMKAVSPQHSGDWHESNVARAAIAQTEGR